MKLNEHLLIKNEETYDYIKNKEIEFEFSNENLLNNLNSNNNMIQDILNMKKELNNSLT